MVRGNKFKPKPAAAVAADTNAAAEQPLAAGAQPLPKDPELKAAGRLPPQNGSLGPALAAGRSCGGGASEAPGLALPVAHSGAGLNGCAGCAGTGEQEAKRRRGRAAIWDAAPDARDVAPVLLRKAARRGLRGACAGAAAAARDDAAAAAAVPARLDPDGVAADAWTAGKQKRQAMHAPAVAAADALASARPAAGSPAPGHAPGGAAAPARKRRRSAPVVAAPTDDSAQARSMAQNGVSAKPALAAVRTEVQSPGATGEAPFRLVSPRSCGPDYRLCMHTCLSSVHITAGRHAFCRPCSEQSRTCHCRGHLRCSAKQEKFPGLPSRLWLAGVPINANWAALKAAVGAGVPRHAPANAKVDSADAARARPERMGAAEGPTPVLAVDCEMVGLGPNGQRSSLARCESLAARKGAGERRAACQCGGLGLLGHRAWGRAASAARGALSVCHV